MENGAALCDSPIIICGDLNFDLTSTRGARIASFLWEIHEVHVVRTLGVTTRYGTSIDAILHKHRQTESIPYISYFSVHRPYLTRFTDGPCRVYEQQTAFWRHFVERGTSTNLNSNHQGEFEVI